MFSRYMNKRYHSSPDNGSGEGCGNVDCEYRDRCDRTGENCLRHSRGHEEGQPFDAPGPRFREGADGGHPCRICEYFYECDHSGKDCRRRKNLMILAVSFIHIVINCYNIADRSFF